MFLLNFANEITIRPLSILFSYSKSSAEDPAEILLYELLQIGERREASLQNTVHVRDSRSVVGKGNAGVCGAFRSVGNLALTEHTASAVDHKVIFFKAFGELPAGGKLEAQAFDSRMSANP